MTRRFRVLIRRRKPARTVGFGKRDSARTRQFRVLIRRQNRPGQLDLGIRKTGFGPDSRIRKNGVRKTTVPRFNSPVEPARTVGRMDEQTDFVRENRPGQTASV